MRVFHLPGRLARAHAAECPGRYARQLPQEASRDGVVIALRPIGDLPRVQALYKTYIDAMASLMLLVFAAAFMNLPCLLS